MDDDAFVFADAETRVRAFAHVVLLVVAAFAGAIALASVGYVVFSAFGYEVPPQVPEVRAVVNALQFVGLALVGLWYVDWADARDLLHLDRPTVRDAGWTLLGLVVLFGLFVALGYLLQYLDVETASNAAVTAGREHPRLLLYSALVSILFTAPAEEFLFRGLVQGLFRRAYGVIPGIVLASVVFGAVHYLALGDVGSKWAYVAIAGALGIVLGAVYERTETLLAPVAIHGLFNAYQFLLVYAVETGVVEAA